MMKKIRCTKKVALMYNVLEEKDGCIKTDVLLYSVLKTKKVVRRTKNAHMYMVLIDNGWMINEKEALNKSATVNVWRMFCLNKKVVQNLALLKKKTECVGTIFWTAKKSAQFLRATKQSATTESVEKPFQKKRGRQTCPGNKSLLAARKYAGDPYKEKMDVNAKMVSGSRNIFKQKRAISAPERCALTNKVKAGRE